MLLAVSCTLKQSSKNFIVVSAGNYLVEVGSWLRSCSIIDRTALETMFNQIICACLSFISD